MTMLLQLPLAKQLCSLLRRSCFPLVKADEESSMLLTGRCNR